MFSVFFKVRTRRTFRVVEAIAKLFNLQLCGANSGRPDFKIVSSDNFLNFQKFLLLLGELRFLPPKDKTLIVKKFGGSCDLTSLNEVLKEELLFVPRKLGSRFGRKKLPLGPSNVRLLRVRRSVSKKKKAQIEFVFFKMGNNFVSAAFFFKNLESFFKNQFPISVPLKMNLVFYHKYFVESISSLNLLLFAFSYVTKLNANY